jgi:PAS domain S-box-containing protein
MARALEIMDDAVIAIDGAHRIRFFNQGAGQLFGYEPQEVLGHPLALLLPPGMGPGHESLVRAFAAGASATRFMGHRGEISGRRRDGTVFPAEATITRHRHGRRMLFTAILRDVTERKANESALRLSEANYRGLVEGSPVGILRLSADGRFTMVNPAVVAILGHETREGVLALDVSRDVYSNPTEYERVRREFLAASADAVQETTWKRRDGRTILVCLTGHAVHAADGSVEHFELRADDITAQRAHEAERRQAQKLEAVRQLTVGLAHNLNNQLSVVVAGVDALEAMITPAPGDLGIVLADMRGAATAGSNLIHQVLRFSRGEELAFETTDLAAVLPTCGHALRPLLASSIRVSCVPFPSPCLVKLDRSAFSQILQHLATNARDAMPAGGTLRVALSREPGAEPGKNGHVVVTVTDTGTGMDEATRERAFDPFFTTKEQGAGTGLGLALVHGLMQQHGGRVELTSEPGRGTAVRLSFPETASAPLAASAAGGVQGGRETVLLAEDDDALRRTTVRVLERFGYTVLAAQDGAEALELYRREPEAVNLVVSDVLMPKLDGQQLYEALQADGLSVPFLFVSAHASRSAKDAAGIGPDVPFVAKPWSTPDFLATVRGLLDGAAQCGVTEAVNV